MNGHHPYAADGVDRYHALVVVACSQHGSHALQLNAEDDIAWLVARNLKRYFDREHLKASIVEWCTSDEAEDAVINDDDTFAAVLGGWPE
jgi:hypothetical protein